MDYFGIIIMNVPLLFREACLLPITKDVFRCAQTLSECKTYEGISFINSNGIYIMPDYCAKLAERPRGCLQSNSTPVQIGNLAWGIMRP